MQLLHEMFSYIRDLVASPHMYFIKGKYFCMQYMGIFVLMLLYSLIPHIIIITTDAILSWSKLANLPFYQSSADFHQLLNCPVNTVKATDTLKN